MLQSGIKHKSFEQRSKAVAALGLLPHNIRATRLAETALRDEKPEVRIAAANALGQMPSRSSISKIRAALSDPEPAVALAAAHALLLVHDVSAYDVFYEVLTGQRKTSQRLAQQMESLKRPKKLAELGFEQGIGFVPFGAIGYAALRKVAKDDSSPVRAACARVLANDPDPATGRVLVDAAYDKSWLVRAAALESIAKRGDPTMLGKIEPALSDDKDLVRYTAAAAVLHLTAMQMRSRKRDSSKSRTPAAEPSRKWLRHFGGQLAAPSARPQ